MSAANSSAEKLTIHPERPCPYCPDGVCRPCRVASHEDVVGGGAILLHDSPTSRCWVCRRCQRPHLEASVEAPLDRPEPSWKSMRVEQPLSTNTIKELRFVPAGGQHFKKDRSGSGTGGGYYMGLAPEAGYYLRLADTVVFVTERQLDEAKAISFEARRPVMVDVYGPPEEPYTEEMRRQDEAAIEQAVADGVDPSTLRFSDG